MGIEAATYITDLVPANPGSSDLRSQGDDHIRLIKQVLQNTFPTLNKVWYPANTASKNADFTVVAADQNKTFIVDTLGGVVNMTLPTLAPGDAGWECFHIKVSAGVNPVMVKPASGTLTSGAIVGLAAARRSVPGSRIRSFWTGTSWYISRSEGLPGPVGSCIEYHGATLPYGYEWPNGQTLASVATAYPEYNAAIGSGVTLDKRSRVGLALDNLGGAAAGRLAGGFITGTAIGNVGGVDNVVLATTQIQSHSHANNLVDNNHTHQYQDSSVTQGGGGTSVFIGIGTQTLTTSGPSVAPMGINNAAAGGGLSHSNLQPSIMVAQLLVVE